MLFFLESAGHFKDSNQRNRINAIEGLETLVGAWALGDRSDQESRATSPTWSLHLIAVAPERATAKPLSIDAMALNHRRLARTRTGAAPS
ncbi:hypothetical protein Sp245p_31455 (plasmid) [Azospirillum baldaniorum]|uniref:Uncharacterized protein n=1 Tax=Azospirillum baldaniorum TaxID=1064539 RepID=A0A9P1K1J3_9PROT|nr:hypothetical protein Sp245p_31455 [Azospirillum baldaniorum]TWA70428.1 hypothetical protein FBZ85_12347 [Azospirillum brasilense]CCD03831.1 protein of unknown function [Azospirillum baldaniorum]